MTQIPIAQLTSPNGDPNETSAAYVDREAWQIQQIEEAIEQADRPDAEWVSHEKVSEWLNTWGDGDEISAPCP
jgi:RHH-type transcriptional regulator, rel operon repressor / antitoxin RelB